MRCDYNYRIVYRDPRDNNEQYSYTSCRRFGTVEDALKHFETEGYDRKWVTDCYRLIKNKKEPIKQKL